MVSLISCCGKRLNAYSWTYEGGSVEYAVEILFILIIYPLSVMRKLLSAFSSGEIPELGCTCISRSTLYMFLRLFMSTYACIYQLPCLAMHFAFREVILQFDGPWKMLPFCG